MIKTVLLDMDGVVADFVGSVLRLNGLYHHDVLPRMKGAYDIDKLIGQAPKEFWGKISEEPSFWADLQKTHEADELMSLVTLSRSPSQVYFCSSPCLDPQSHWGKAVWVEKHYREYLTRLILCSHKHLLANRDTLLIDDSDKNVEAFRKAGGRAILFPRPWNSKFAFSDDPLKLVIPELRRL